MASRSSVPLAERPPDGPGSLARVGRRVAALIIDWAGSLAVAGLATRAAYASPSHSLTTLVVFFLEVSVLTALAGASFGQRIVGLRVERLAGGNLTPLAALVRTALICLVVPPLVYDAHGRGLHDKAAGSVVVRAR